MRAGVVSRSHWVRLTAALPAAALIAVLPMAPASATEGSNTSSSCQAATSAGWRSPLQQRYVITSPFGYRTDPISHVYQLHAGVDLAMLPGPGPVVAADEGTVVRVGPDGGLGNEVTLQHTGGVQTLYGHMAHTAAGLKPGMHVAAGQVLGLEGSTGASTGPHLHFEVHLDGKPVDPVPFMAARGVPLDGTVQVSQASAGFALPAAGVPRKASLHQTALPVPAELMTLYLGASQKYGVPWPLLAGVGMEETGQGRNNHTSSAGAKGLMQFLPSTFARYGVDGNGDGRADILNDADSVYSAANALRAWGATAGAAGIRQALYSYNHATWYVNDVLHYAAEYAAGSGARSCTSASVPAPSSQAATAVTWGRSQVGRTYLFGAEGPDKWDSSAFVQAAYAKAGIQLPRTAQQQRNWLAAGHGTRVSPGEERPGDLIFEDSYLGPDKVGYVMLVTDPREQRAVAAQDPQRNVGYTTYAGAQDRKHIFQIWRVTVPTKPAHR